MWVAQLDTIKASDPNSSKALLDPRELSNCVCTCIFSEQQVALMKLWNCVFACQSCLLSRCLFLHGETGISTPCPFLNLSLCLNLCPVTSYCSFTSPPKDAAAWLVYGTDKMNRDWSKRPEVIVMSLSVPFLQAMLVFFSHPVMRQPFFQTSLTSADVTGLMWCSRITYLTLLMKQWDELEWFDKS